MRFFSKKWNRIWVFFVLAIVFYCVAGSVADEYMGESEKYLDAMAVKNGILLLSIPGFMYFLLFDLIGVRDTVFNKILRILFKVLGAVWLLATILGGYKTFAAGCALIYFMYYWLAYQVNTKEWGDKLLFLSPFILEIAVISCCVVFIWTWVNIAALIIFGVVFIYFVVHYFLKKGLIGLYDGDYSWHFNWFQRETRIKHRISVKDEDLYSQEFIEDRKREGVEAQREDDQARRALEKELERMLYTFREVDWDEIDLEKGVASGTVTHNASYPRGRPENVVLESSVNNHLESSIQKRVNDITNSSEYKNVSRFVGVKITNVIDYPPDEEKEKTLDELLYEGRITQGEANDLRRLLDEGRITEYEFNERIRRLQGL